MLVNMRNRVSGENIAVIQGLDTWQKSLTAPDLIHIDGEHVLLLGDLGASLAGHRWSYLGAGIRLW